jgi:hypothetical protein
MSLSTGPGCAAIYRIRTISLGSVKTIFTDLAKDFPSTDFKHALIIHLDGDLEGESLLAAIRDDFIHSWTYTAIEPLTGQRYEY